MDDGTKGDDLLLWVDLETTGTDLLEDEIIEIGCIVTDRQLDKLFEYQAVIKPSDKGMGRLMLNPVVREMHTKNNLIGDIIEERTGGNCLQVTQDLTGMLEREFPGRRFIVAGSGVGPFDRPFINIHMPLLARLCRYYVFDVSVIRRAMTLFAGEDWLAPAQGNEQTAPWESHRALADIRVALDEARDYKALWDVTFNKDDEEPKRDEEEPADPDSLALAFDAYMQKWRTIAGEFLRKL